VKLEKPEEENNTQQLPSWLTVAYSADISVSCT